MCASEQTGVRAKRDEAPLILISWLSFQLDPHVQALIDALMLYLSTSEVIITDELLEIERNHPGDTADFSTLEELRDALIIGQCSEP